MQRSLRDALVSRYAPQLATLVATPPRGSGWIHELKLDGYRAGAIVAAGDVRLISRRRNDLTAEFPEIARALRTVAAHDAIFDGEIVMLDARGRTDFQALQNRATSRAGLAFFVFDVLWLDGTDITGLPLERRKARLQSAIAGAGPEVRFSDHFEVSRAAASAKRSGASYARASTRSRARTRPSRRRRRAGSAGTHTGSIRSSSSRCRSRSGRKGDTSATRRSRGSAMTSRRARWCASDLRARR